MVGPHMTDNCGNATFMTVSFELTMNWIEYDSISKATRLDGRRRQNRSSAYDPN